MLCSGKSVKDWQQIDFLFDEIRRIEEEWKID